MHVNMHSTRAKMYFYYHVYFGLFFASSCLRLICVQGNFSVGSTGSNPYNCTTNLICLGDAHIMGPYVKYEGMLSLVNELGALTSGRSGIAYYNQPVRMLDNFTRQAASFNTSFVIVNVAEQPSESGSSMVGDGMVFVISADNVTVGYSGSQFGFFQKDGSNSFKSIVVEFDTFYNPNAPEYDISWDHVSIEFKNISAVATRNASEVGLDIGKGYPIYAWVEYSNETQLLEVRISSVKYRPPVPLLTHTVDLFDVADEYMWVGFSGGNAGFYSYYYVGEWSFESWGIKAAPNFESRGSPAPAPYFESGGSPASAPYFEPSGSPVPPKARSKVRIIVGIAVGVPTLLLIAGFILLCFVRRRSMRSATGTLTRWLVPVAKGHSDGEDPMLQLAGMGKGYQFSYKQLSVATGDFNEEAKLGQGGAGSVYRGVLPTSGTPVAVKKISGESKNGEKLFLDEVLSISQLRHRNLILLLGWCTERDKYLIVYELMSNGSLDKVLFGLDERHTPLSWPQRLNILRGTAAALEYLQQGWKQQVIHRDIKSSNIMLDAEWNAKLGDFGLARLVDHQRTPAITLVAGTWGYIAPEAAATGKFTDKTDIFSFGAVALEIACGRRSVSLQLPPDEMILVDWVWDRFSEGNLLSVVDRRLGDYDVHWMEVVLQMGLLCSHPNPLARPTMRHIVQVLVGDAPVPSVPAMKPAPSFVNETPLESYSWTNS